MMVEVVIDECGCGWIGSWVVALSVMGFDRGYGCWVCLVKGSGDVLAMGFFFLVVVRVAVVVVIFVVHG